ncbi:uncharacterized protein LOC144618019 [Crassostrea virginica]
MCCTTSGELLVSMTSHNEMQTKVVRYVGSIDHWDDNGQPPYSSDRYTKYLSENRNFDICMADLGAGAVVVVNAAGKLRFRYTGPPSAKQQSFKPLGITTDSRANILTADRDNHIN